MQNRGYSETAERILSDLGAAVSEAFMSGLEAAIAARPNASADVLFAFRAELVAEARGYERGLLFERNRWAETMAQKIAQSSPIVAAAILATTGKPPEAAIEFLAAHVEFEGVFHRWRAGAQAPGADGAEGNSSGG